ncbi:hypothetical protein [Bradyrhizobium paxllaeri]|uniref:hypothetical protein n=1 Tax=Bradyrhizobium paxllaeri TaxID=190148 RepID=UPI003221CF00
MATGRTEKSPALAKPDCLILATQFTSTGNSCPVWSRLNWKSCPRVKAVMAFARRNWLISEELLGIGTRTSLSAIGMP